VGLPHVENVTTHRNNKTRLLFTATITPIISRSVASSSRQCGCDLAADLLVAHNNVIIPEGIGVATVALPAKVHPARLRLDAAPLPLRCVCIAHTRLRGQACHSGTVEPRLDGAIGADVVFEAAPGVDRNRDGRCDTLRREIRKSRIIRFAVVHQDLRLASDAQVLVGTLCWVRVGDERDVRVGERLGGLAVGQSITCAEHIDVCYEPKLTTRSARKDHPLALCLCLQRYGRSSHQLHRP